MAQDLNRYYEKLGIEKDASAAEIKSAFRRLARELHPDLNPGQPEKAERFRDIHQAYEVILALAKFQEAQSPAKAGLDYPELAWRLAAVDKDGLDVIYHLEIDALAAKNGGRAIVPHRHDIPCPVCKGAGEVKRWSWSRLGLERQACQRCRGTGRIERVENIAVRLPADLSPNDRFRLAGHGLFEPQSGRRGDLFVQVRTSPSPSVKGTFGG